ncbi:putative DNA binding domain-containing protein [Fulvivirgaceae bacterium PWU4]|uniref:DNA binding domain-containing protein n=1 Tax=Chryseosolibacter histidini TaxID=2782349 RepID=A0AAP2DNE0_9BACT|nr:ATP-binding protein [Chryseosolibacter histidini]MBT1699491.1 putative DNA binding domain-containing protein [Chryseosolibacter histidini]
MNDEIRDEVRAKVLQYLSFGRLETNKFELKREWYNLRESHGKNEFLRDATAIINSYGGENAFIVFGVAESKELFDTKIEDSGYKDSASIKDIIDANVDKPFRFDVDHVNVNGKNLCFIYLHPSLDKPHVIVKYVNDNKGRAQENAIFIRSGSAKVSPTKGDLDRMYIERNTILVERKADVSINFHGFHFSTDVNNRVATHTLERPLLIENRGTRVLAVYKIFLQFDLGDEKLVFIHETIAKKPIVIPPNDIYRENLKFFCKETPHRNQTSNKLNNVVNSVLENPRHGDVVCTLLLATGEDLPTNLFMPNINHAKLPPVGVRIY